MTTWVIDEMRGMAIRGVMSSAVVSVILGSEEQVFWANARLHQQHRFDHVGQGRLRGAVGGRRYVDDAIVASRNYCCRCLEDLARLCYAEPLFVVARSSDLPPGMPILLLDIELRVFGQEFL